MSIEVNLIKNRQAEFLPPLSSLALPLKGFEITKDDDLYLENPYVDNLPVAVRWISLDIDTDDVKVEFADGLIGVIPAGVLPAGVPHRMDVVKVFATGTGVTVRVFGWLP